MLYLSVCVIGVWWWWGEGAEWIPGGSGLWTLSSPLGSCRDSRTAWGVGEHRNRSTLVWVLVYLSVNILAQLIKLCTWVKQHISVSLCFSSSNKNNWGGKAWTHSSHANELTQQQGDGAAIAPQRQPIDFIWYRFTDTPSSTLLKSNHGSILTRLTVSLLAIKMGFRFLSFWEHCLKNEPSAEAKYQPYVFSCWNMEKDSLIRSRWSEPPPSPYYPCSQHSL